MNAARTSLVLGVAFLFFGILIAGLFGSGNAGGNAAPLILLVIGICFVVGAMFLPGSPTEGSTEGGPTFAWSCEACDFENHHAGKVSVGDELHCSNCGAPTTVELRAGDKGKAQLPHPPS